MVRGQKGSAMNANDIGYVINTRDIMCDAYARIFDIPSSKDKDQSYYDQRYESVYIDYAIFDVRRSTYATYEFDPDTDYFWAKVESGCEGTWIAVYREHDRYGDTEEHSTDNIGTIKTLNEGRDAWKSMGALAGELVYVAEQVAWEYYQAQRKAKQAIAERG